MVAPLVVVRGVVVDVDELLVVVVELVDVVVPLVGGGGQVGFDGGRHTAAGRIGSDEVGPGWAAGCVVVLVVLVVDEVIRTTELGTVRSGIRRVPSVGLPANRVTATTPTRTSTTPLDAAMIVDCWRHHPVADGSYSGKSSRAKSS